MFCNQCEQTAGKACMKIGVCGKKDEVAGLQDLLVYALEGLALFAGEARRLGIVSEACDRFTYKALFATLTNVNFDPERLAALVRETVARREELKKQIAAQNGKTDFAEPQAAFQPGADLAAMEFQGQGLRFLENLDADENIRSLKQILLFGVKGIAAYADHAAILGKHDPEVAGFLYQALCALMARGLTVEQCAAAAMQAGKINLKAMELLDAGNTGHFGHPEPTQVSLGHRKGKCILVSGHDLRDLELLLKATEGKGIDIYTHGEMLPAHAYPEFKKYPHFVGHFGTAWQNQQQELPHFPGPVLFTTNCLQKPGADYADRVFTTGLVGWPGIRHIGENKDFSALIAAALAAPGFADDADRGTVLTGFARNAVLGVADKVTHAVKSGAIRRFFLVGGCDGAKPGRNYYKELVQQIPRDCVILTLACGKFRFFDQKLGEIGGIPRLLDLGQCNDAYSAVQIAVALAKAFNCGVNDLPLSFILSWYEQKAVAILLSLLSLGVKDIRLGPTLPAFITPAVLQYLVDHFNIWPITTPEEDLQAILG